MTATPASAVAAHRGHDRIRKGHPKGQRRNPGHRLLEGKEDEAMTAPELHAIAKAMVAKGKGILAMDESNPTCGRRFKKLGI